MAESKDAEKSKTVAGVRVTAKPEVFRRAGHVFTREPREIALSELTDAQVKALEGEPMLVVERVRIDASAPDAAAR